jgi:hypothetical protein
VIRIVFGSLVALVASLALACVAGDIGSSATQADAHVPEPVPVPDSGSPDPDAAPPAPLWDVVRHSDPPRSEIVSLVDGSWLATFTDGASTVTVRGPLRTFSEPSAPSPVEHDVWVRLLPAPFDGVMDASDDAWLAAALADAGDDLLAIGMQYLAAAPPIFDGALQIAGDASYGPLVDGVRQEGSDWNDYLGIDAVYHDGAIVDPPEALQLGSLDCSGYVRMIYGYRAGLPLGPGPDGLGVELPRRAVQIEASAPGVPIIVNTGAAPPTTPLAPGDLVFFDADEGDGPDVDHVGIYLGVDGDGRPRFLSSRKTADGPTLGDDGGCSCLDGTGIYATSFRSARRL